MITSCALYIIPCRQLFFFRDSSDKQVSMFRTTTCSNYIVMLVKPISPLTHLDATSQLTSNHGQLNMSRGPFLASRADAQPHV